MARIGQADAAVTDVWSDVSGAIGITSVDARFDVVSGVNALKLMPELWLDDWNGLGGATGSELRRFTGIPGRGTET